MKKDAPIFLRHILESIAKVEEYTKDDTLETFLALSEKQDAVIRRIEIIGEAVRNIPEELKKKYPEVPWSEAIRTRDKIIHGYFGVDLEITWQIVVEDLPKLKKKIQAILLKEERKR